MKLKNKNIIKITLYVLLVVLVYIIIFSIFKVDKAEEELDVNNLASNIEITDNELLPTPDRIIFKNRNNQYIIIDYGTNEYKIIYSELYNRMTNLIDGKVYSEQEISGMQNSGSFIEFDYNTKSKNFVFMFDKNEIGVIKRFSDSGQVIKTSLENKETLLELIEKLTKDKTKYDFNKEYNYTSENKLNEVPSDLGFSEVRQGVYQKIFNDTESNYQNILEKLNFQTNTEIANIDFNKYSIILTISQYEIKQIEQNIGSIKYEFGEFLDKYNVNFLAVSNVVNINCIYYNVTDLSEYTTVKNETNTNKDEYSVDYYIENSKYYAITNDEKIEIISLEKACDIADEEAKDTKYQYQPWKSEFYTRGKDKNDFISAELISNLSDISKFYHWNEEWKKSEYEGILMWKIRLFDENDPLTSLYIYINAINGNVIGAGASSD